MSRAQHLKETIKALPAKTPKAVQDFAAEFFAKVPDDDMDLMTPAGAAQVITEHWELMCARKKGTPVIHAYTRPVGEGDGSLGHTVINIVNDDMAFLVDSVAAEIARHGRLIRQLVHPILHVTYDRNGKIKKAQAQPGDDTHAQSHMHIEVIGTLPEPLLRQLEKDLMTVLRDVRFATQDWLKMKERLKEAENGLARAPKKYRKEEVDEYIAFLEYLYKDNFTLLGCRAYKFTEKDGQVKSQVVKGSSLGLLNNEVKPVYINEGRDGLPEDLQRLRRDMPPLTVAKVNKPSTVHRRVPLDAVAVKQFDENGKVCGEMLFIGLFTSVTYSRSINDVPLLRRKAGLVLEKSGYRPGSHNYKALRHILEKYPRDEIFQIGTGDLLGKAQSILLLQERQRIALYTRTDPFGRYISCLVYIPKDRYDTRMRIRFQEVLEEELNGTCGNFYTTLDDSPLARVMYMIYVDQDTKPKFREREIEKRLQDVGRLWSERLGDALLTHFGDSEEEITRYLRKYGEAFPVNYRDEYEPKQAVHDIVKIEEALVKNIMALDLYRCKDCSARQVRLKIYHKNDPVSLSDILPVLENMGMRVSAEFPYEIAPQQDDAVWVHDFIMELENDVSTADVENNKPLFEDALQKIWYGHVENDGLNRLIIGAGMDWREIMVLRACVRYLRQAQVSFSTRYIERALTNNKDIARHIVDLFKALFDPANDGKADKMAAGCVKAIEQALNNVPSLDEDRILRSITNLVQATLRTNYFQPDENGQDKTYLSLKLESRKIPELPEPRPYREIYVYAPWMEGIHLRGDKIARGGIRWSDRHEDFRTEVLGLMKAQQVKNSLIVPMGAKGGFIVKNPPAGGDRKALQAEGIKCYKTLVRGMLDITDNRKGQKVIHPRDVVRRDEEDPYLVVAADKGTASFSDIANALSADYDFWLGDAFASGGSAGYDHKKMGITARGAWESVKRHFREMNHDIQKKPFDVIGVGDMGGDVFGNGMLLSEHIRLVGAFNHLHIFCDPDPDPARSFKERKRLFENVMGWDEYNTDKLSKGARIYSRKDKSLSLTPEIKARFGIEKDNVPPGELIQAMLRAPTDLLWFGGIGTYIKSSDESHADVGDKANDMLRVNADEIRARVIGEGANLAVTQLARIEYAQKGGRINADFVDNSAGVDSSDHEVNIKILMTDIMRAKTSSMTLKSRNKLLAEMTEEVAELVLRNNYQQAQGLSMMELQAVDDLPLQARFISDLEAHHGLNRKLEALPDEETLTQRKNAGKGLTRPELAVVQAYAKILFTTDLLATNIPDKEAMADTWLIDYFPKPLRKKYADSIRQHRLRREIVATNMATSLVNRMGPTFVKGLMNKTGASAAEVAEAYLVVREAFDLRGLWDRIEGLDGQVPGVVQLKAMRDIVYMVEHETTWFLTRLGRAPDMAKDIPIFNKGITELRRNLRDAATADQARAIKHRTEMGVADGLPKELALDIALIPVLGTACDITRISNDANMQITTVARTYYEIGEHFHIDWLLQQARFMNAEDRWSSEAAEALIEQLYSCQAGLTMRVLGDMRKAVKANRIGNGGVSILQGWIRDHGHQATLMEPLLNDFRRSGAIDLPMLIIAEQRLRALHGG